MNPTTDQSTLMESLGNVKYFSDLLLSTEEGYLYAYLFWRKNPPCMPLLNPVQLLILAINFQLFSEIDQRLL